MRNTVCPWRSCLLLLFFLTFAVRVEARDKMIIAESGGGKNIIDHSLPAATLAVAMGVEYLELQVVMTADDQLIVFHDTTLDRLTDVAVVFPDRKRDDGAYYVIDFSLDELRRIRLLSAAGGAGHNEFPLTLAIPTLAEELALLQRLQSILDRQLGIVLEIRQPWFHLQAGKDISIAILDTLSKYGLTTAKDKVFLQSFDPEELQRIHSQLMPERRMNFSLIQLVGDNDGVETKQLNLGQLEPYNYDWMFTNTGIRMLASYATAIAMPADTLADMDNKALLTGYVGEAHRQGLMVLAYPFSKKTDTSAVPQDFKTLVDFYFSRAGIDGMYTDSFRDVQRYLKEGTAKSRCQRATHHLYQRNQSRSQPRCPYKIRICRLFLKISISHAPPPLTPNRPANK